MESKGISTKSSKAIINGLTNGAISTNVDIGQKVLEHLKETQIESNEQKGGTDEEKKVITSILKGSNLPKATAVLTFAGSGTTFDERTLMLGHNDEMKIGRCVKNGILPNKVSGSEHNKILVYQQYLQ